MVAPIIAAGVVIAWLVIVVLVHHNKGWVGISDARRSMLRLTGGLTLLSFAIGGSLLPILRRTTKAMIEFNKSMATLSRALERDRV